MDLWVKLKGADYLALQSQGFMLGLLDFIVLITKLILGLIGVPCLSDICICGLIQFPGVFKILWVEYNVMD